MSDFEANLPLPTPLAARTVPRAGSNLSLVEGTLTS